jgi:transcription factor SPN1
MEALRAKKRAATASTQEQSSKNKSSSKNKKDDGTSGGYGSEDSYNSATYVRTAEDDDFIDTQGEDEELVKEYYAEQHFDDERPDELEEMEVKTKKSSGRRSTTKKRGPDQLSEQDKKDKDNPISIAVERMKKKKKVPKRFEELKDSAVELIDRMEDAAKQDDRSFRAKKPGLKKLQMLPEVLNAMIKREMMRPLLEADFLTVAKTWIEPLSDGSLGNVTMRQKMIDGISKMNGDFGIDNDDLKRSEFGKLVMTLYMHKKETPEMKRRLKSLIEQWSRRIFRKSGDMKNLGTSQAQRRGDSGLVGIARAQAASNESQMANQRRSGQKRENKDLGSILSGGVKQAQTSGSNRVRVPYSKGFQYTVRPDNKSGDVSDKKTRISTVTDQRESLHRRMLDKNKRGGKNSRSANISIEGRPTK